MRRFVPAICAAMDALESRQLLSVALGTNVIVNPGAEANVGATTRTGVVHPSGWTFNHNATAVKYGSPGGFPTATSPGPSSRGNNFFAGGPGMESDLFQLLDVSSLSGLVDVNKLM